MGTKACKLDNRRLHIRTSGKEQKGRWYEFCEERGMTISELVRDAVESVINPSEDVKGSRELREEIAQLNTTILELENELDVRNMAIENCQKEIENLKMQQFVEDDIGKILPNPKLVATLMENKRAWTENELFVTLGISQVDIQGMKALGSQLRWLEDFGVVKSRRGKWRWVG